AQVFEDMLLLTDMRLLFRFVVFLLDGVATWLIETLSLHDALPICSRRISPVRRPNRGSPMASSERGRGMSTSTRRAPARSTPWRSEEHTSELQSPYDIVCRLPLEKTKTSRTRKFMSSISKRTRVPI